MNALIHELEARQLIQDCTDLAGLSTRLDQGPTAAYCGFDPTADSLHVGSLTPLAVLRIFQRHGHRPIVLIGGATGFIGDPSGRSQERTLLDADTLNTNCAGLAAQTASLLPGSGGLPDAVLVNNWDWIRLLDTITFLREVGRHFQVNDMVRAESVRQRFGTENGISFTEFAYPLLQALDWDHLQQTMGCDVQLGGSDQWGNIVAGTHLIARRGRSGAFGLTWPLLLKADGAKFGKTADGNVWLDPARTSPFKFHQFWVQTTDDLVESLLLRFTDDDPPAIAELMARHRARPEARKAQRHLAASVTAWVHGTDRAQQAEAAAEVLFGRRSCDARAVEVLADEVPTTRLTAAGLAELDLAGLAVRVGLAASRSESRRLIDQGGLSIGGRPVVALPDDAGSQRFLVLRRGRRDHHVVIVEP